MSDINFVKDNGRSSMEEVLLAAIKKIKYGRVEVFVHDSKVVQLETTEKIRFDSNA